MINWHCIGMTELSKILNLFDFYRHSFDVHSSN